MVEENISQEFRLKNIDETRNYFVEEIEQNELMSKNRKKVCTTLKLRKIVWKQTKRYFFNFFNPNFLEPTPPKLHKNCKQTEAKLSRYYF